MTLTSASPAPLSSAAIPTELRGLPQWVGWRLIEREGANKPRKLPLRPFDGAPASTTDPTTWGTFEQALACPRASGVGFVFTSGDPYVGVDLDGCRDPLTGVLEPWAAAAVERLNSYTEVSPSGTGVHVIVRGTLPPGRRRSGAVEMYSEARYFTMTGQLLSGTTGEIRERSSELHDLHEQFFQEAARVDERPSLIHHSLSDEQLIVRADSATNGAKFRRLWSGDAGGYASASEADLALCSLLAFWTGPDQARVDRLFRRSGLMRPKWDEQHGENTYGARTIAVALERTDFYGDRSSSRVKVPPDDPQLNELALSDAGNAEAFAHLQTARVVFDHRRNRWLIWGAHRWVPDRVAEVRLLAKWAVRARLRASAALPDSDQRARAAKHALGSESRLRLDAMLELAKSEPALADAGNSWDAELALLAAENGVIDLRTGAVRPGRPEDRITLAVPIPYHADAACPRFERFVEEIFEGDRELIAFAQRAIGYSLTGDTSEHALFMLYGTGRNSKSVLLNVLRALAGDYGLNLPFSAFELAGRSQLSPDLAMLPGKRLVTSSETNDGTRLNEARIKAMTGGDAITANPKYMTPFEFVPVAKFWLGVNHLPNIRDDSEGFWRRVKVIRFPHTFGEDEVDRQLESKLRAELPGILAWAVRGAIEWHQRGLAEPPGVRLATREYREESDLLAVFLQERCLIGTGAEVRAGELFVEYVRWCDEGVLPKGERMSSQAFGRRMTERFAKRSTKRGKVYHGIGVLVRREGDGYGSGDGYEGGSQELSQAIARGEEFSESPSLSVTGGISVTVPHCDNGCGRPVPNPSELCEECLVDALRLTERQAPVGEFDAEGSDA